MVVFFIMIAGSFVRSSPLNDEWRMLLELSQEILPVEVYVTSTWAINISSVCEPSCRMLNFPDAATTAITGLQNHQPFLSHHKMWRSSALCTLGTSNHLYLVLHQWHRCLRFRPSIIPSYGTKERKLKRLHNHRQLVPLYSVSRPSPQQQKFYS